MVEMTEVANILRNATSQKSCLSWTKSEGEQAHSTDSPSHGLLWSISPTAHLLGAKTLFATHYHELTELEGKIRKREQLLYCGKGKGRRHRFPAQRS